MLGHGHANDSLEHPVHGAHRGADPLLHRAQEQEPSAFAREGWKTRGKETGEAQGDRGWPA